MRLGNAIIVESIAQMYDFMNDNPKFKGVVIDLEGNIMDSQSGKCCGLWEHSESK